MKKLVLTILLVGLGLGSTMAQLNSSDVEVINQVTVPFDQQLAKLFAHLNFSDVSTGLLAERGFSALAPDDFNGEAKKYSKPSAKAMETWKKQYQIAYNLVQLQSYRIPDLRKQLLRMDSLVNRYFLPTINMGIPLDIQKLHVQTSAYQQLDSLLSKQSTRHAACINPVKYYLSVTTQLLNPYIVSYSPQSVEKLLDDDNAANILALRMLYAGMYNASIDTLHRPLLPLENYESKINKAKTVEVVAISMLHVQYYSLSEKAIADNLIQYRNGFFEDVPNRTKSPYIRAGLVAAATTSDTLAISTQFIVRPELFVHNTGKTLQYVHIDFGNGEGYKRLRMNEIISVTYQHGGDVELKYILVYSDATIAVCHSGVFVAEPAFQSFSFNPSQADAVWREFTFRGYGKFTAAATVIRVNLRTFTFSTK